MTHNRSLRWHMHLLDSPEQTFIMYGEEGKVRAAAKTLGYVNITASGYYDYRTNTIIDAHDGPWYCSDVRKAPGA